MVAMCIVLLTQYRQVFMKTDQHECLPNNKVHERVPASPPIDENVHQFTKTQATVEYYQNNTRVHIIIIARMSTGSTAMGSMLGKVENSLYVYEPDHLFLKFVYHKNVYVDRASYLKEMQPRLCTFFEELYQCAFASNDYLDGLNKCVLYRRKGQSLQYLSYPISKRELTSFCRSKANIISKVLRFVDIESCLPTLKENKVKLIFLARDPRGMVTSRLRRWDRFLTPLAAVSNANYYPTKAIVKEHCDWLTMVYNLLQNASKWLRDNSMLIRFEDMCQYPDVINQAVYDFVGLAPSSLGVGKPHNISLASWLNIYSYPELKEIQDYCPRHVYDDFGWRRVNSKEEFERAKASPSWYHDIPAGRVALKYKIPS
ncbi:carbohydrate sulfotransferase 1-like [Ptychodera flava]|uniref:carbohydrate sulfotransferase 1-like n=1 Tax=Ptychodera flava TaxID=63121 RepID=UPI00396A4AC6